MPSPLLAGQQSPLQGHPFHMHIDRHHQTGWRDEEAWILVHLSVPASIPFPKPVEEINRYHLDNEIGELENAIALLELSDEQVFGTSTYNGVARYIN